MLGKTVALMALRSPEKNVQVSHARTALSQERVGSKLAVPCRSGSACASPYPEPGLWGRSVRWRVSSARRAEWPEVRISGHASELCWGAVPSSTPGIGDPEGQLEPPSLGSGRSLTDAAESEAQSPVTPEPSGASGLGARKLCPETAQVKLGSERGSSLSSPSSLLRSLLS